MTVSCLQSFLLDIVRCSTQCDNALCCYCLHTEVNQLMGITAEINQLEKLEAAKTASLVCISLT